MLSWLRTQTSSTVDPLSDGKREVLAAQLELFRLARADGRSALTAHARPDASPIFARYSQLATLPFACRLLGETMRFLADETRTTEELEVMIDAWLSIELVRGSLSPEEQRIVRCIRAATLAFHAGARPVVAMRVGRALLASDDRVTTVDLTKFVKEMQVL